MRTACSTPHPAPVLPQLSMTKVEEYDMTITSPRSPAGSTAGRNSIRWTAVQAGLWVGKVDGEFAGMIEAKWGEGFTATTRLAKNLGTFATVEEAKASFTE